MSGNSRHAWRWSKKVEPTLLIEAPSTASKKWDTSWGQQLIAQALRFAAASQAIWAVVFHASWILMLAAAMTTGDGSGDGLKGAGRALLRVFFWLGGGESRNHLGTEEVATAWAKLSVVIYIVSLAIAPLRARRARWSLLRKSLLSAGIALTGFSIAIAMLGALASGSWLIIGMTVATFMATAWALAVARFVNRLIRWMHDQPRAAAD